MSIKQSWLDNLTTKQQSQKWAVVVAQLVERLHTAPEVRGSNSDIGKIVQLKKR